MNDPYEILGVNEHSSDDDIKKAYRNLAKKYHPDLNKEENTEEKFKEINDAYDKINTEEKRNNLNNTFNFNTDFNFDDLVNDYFRQHRTYKEKRNTDLFLNYRISLQDAFNGKSSIVSYNINENGKLKEVDFNITIPKAVENDVTLCFSGKGNKEDTNKPPGDLYVSIKILPDKFERVTKYDITYKHTINYLDALTGGNFELDLLNGRKVRVKYNPLVTNETIMKMAKCGMEDEKHTGDLFIMFNIVSPKLNEEQIEAIKKLRIDENF